MEPNEFQITMRWWLGVGVGRSVCPFCPEVALDPLGHHAATCRHGGDVVVRHNHIHILYIQCTKQHTTNRNLTSAHANLLCPLMAFAPTSCTSDMLMDFVEHFEFGDAWLMESSPDAKPDIRRD